MGTEEIMTNLEYFELSIKHKEDLIDPNYNKIVDRQVIPLTIDEENALTISNKNVIRYISTIETMINDFHLPLDDEKIVSLLELIINELKTKGMNYSAFCQYFNIHNMNYSIFINLSHNEQIEVLKYIIKPYINTRHDIYLSHGYSNIVLQVMSDNYSHKRKGNYGTNKIADCLKLLGIEDLTNSKDKNFNKEKYYLLSDKTGKKLYKKFAHDFGLHLTDEGKETEKFPDALIKIGSDFFIVEQKNMKENGGGQDKQTLEITDFIDRKPEFEGLHYITFIDGIYFNRIDKNAKAKTLQQYIDIVSVLSKYKSNYFVNSFSFEKLIKNTLYDLETNNVLKIVEIK